MLLVLKILYVILTIVRFLFEVYKFCRFLDSEFPQIRVFLLGLPETVTTLIRRVWEGVTTLLKRAGKAVTMLLHRIQEAFTIMRLAPVKKIEGPKERRRR